MEKELQIKKEGMSISVSTLQITRTSDLLKSKSMNTQIKIHGRNEVNLIVAASVTKCLDGLGIEMKNFSIQILVEDIVEKYGFDSIEDVQICLKKGRQGNYGATYGKLNMIIISGWMSKHLEEKAIVREQIDRAKQLKERDLPTFKTLEDYHNWVKIGSKNQKEIADMRKEFKSGKSKEKRKEIEHEEFKAKYDSGGYDASRIQRTRPFEGSG